MKLFLWVLAVIVVHFIYPDLARADGTIANDRNVLLVTLEPPFPPSNIQSQEITRQRVAEARRWDVAIHKVRPATGIADEEFSGWGPIPGDCVETLSGPHSGQYKQGRRNGGLDANSRPFLEPASWNTAACYWVPTTQYVEVRLADTIPKYFAHALSEKRVLERVADLEEQNRLLQAQLDELRNTVLEMAEKQ